MKVSLTPAYASLTDLAAWTRAQMSAIATGWQREHNLEGQHTTITAETLDTSGDVVIGGDLLVQGQIAGFVVTLLDRQLTMVEVTGTTAQTSVYSFTVPGGTFGTTNGLRFHAYGDYLSSGAEWTITTRLKLGATTLLTNADTMVDSADRRSWVMDAQILSRDDDAAQYVTGTFTRGETGGSLLPILLPTRQTSLTTTVNTTIDQDLVLTIDPENAAQSIRTFAVLVEYWK